MRRANVQSRVGKTGKARCRAVTFPCSCSDQSNGLPSYLDAAEGYGLSSNNSRQVFSVAIFNVEVLIGCSNKSGVFRVVWAKITRGLARLLASVKVDAFKARLNYPLNEN